MVGTAANAAISQANPVSNTFITEHPHGESDTNSYSEVVDPEKARLISEIKAAESSLWWISIVGLVFVGGLIILIAKTFIY